MNLENIRRGQFEALVKEYQASGNPQNRRIHTAIRASYGSYYRRMLPKILAALEFRSNNTVHRPLLDAIDAIRRHQGDSRRARGYHPYRFCRLLATGAGRHQLPDPEGNFIDVSE